TPTPQLPSIDEPPPPVPPPMRLYRTALPRAPGTPPCAAAAIVPVGYLRTGMPAYIEDPLASQLRPRAYAAVGADTNGDLVTSATLLDAQATASDGRSAPDLASRITATQREEPSSRVLRQLARCAKEYRCRAA